MKAKATRRIPTSATWRRVALVVHRYVGLVLVVFLATAGLTGSVIAFQEELDELVNPELFYIPAEERHLPNLDPFEIAARMDRLMPNGQRFRSVKLDVEEGHSFSAWVEAEPDKWQEWFVSTKTGKLIGKRTWGDLTEGKRNIIAFLYRLHYSLALGDVGIVLFGVAALLWTLDCFVGAYLTFPPPVPRGAVRRSFVRRWLPAWSIKTNKLFALIFTWHRASGLWVWALLFVFAWSGVGFNLRPVYTPVMNFIFEMKPEGHDLLPHVEPPFQEPKLSLREAAERGRVELAREARERGFEVKREVLLYYAEDHGAYGYRVESSLDISTRHPHTELYLDGQTGKVLAFYAPSGVSLGNTVSSWLFYLHMGAVFGIWYRLVIVFVGLAVFALSVTGVWIWWRKRSRNRGRQSLPSRGAIGELINVDGERNVPLVHRKIGS